MSALFVFVDYDNLDDLLVRPGPVALAQVLFSLLPSNVLARHASVEVRLYGGWRAQGSLTVEAQRIVPRIRSDSPTVAAFVHQNCTKNMRLAVSLADAPIGTRLPLQETLAKDRDLRKFRTRPLGWANCVDSGNCGFAHIVPASHSTRCCKSGCGSQLRDVFVRDEQKMVDTLIVADIAYQALSQRATDIAIVSSDTDMWPGVLLALGAGCNVIHIHTTNGWRTQRHLLQTLPRQASANYQQLSV